MIQHATVNNAKILVQESGLGPNVAYFVVRPDLSAAYLRFASVEQVPDLLAEGGVLGMRHWNASRSETRSTFLQRRKLLKMFRFRLSKWHWARPCPRRLCFGPHTGGAEWIIKDGILYRVPTLMHK
ncbi:MAG: hypothetical protein ACR2NN_19960 [Bryobacteraceae bacterium]